MATTKVQSVTRAFNILNAFDRQRTTLTSSEIAERIGLNDRGRIEVGAIADIAVMDLSSVQDHATFDQPHQYSSGVSHVLVNGVLVLQNGALTGKRPGRSLRSQE